MPIVLDLPVSPLAGFANRRTEIVVNTPYNKNNDDSRRHYGFDGGFYIASDAQVSHPIVERQRQELHRRIQLVMNQFNAVALQLQETNRSWENPNPLMPTVTLLLKTLLENPFTKTTMEATPDDSLLVKTSLNGLKVYIDLDFDEEDAASHEAVLTAFKPEQHTPVVSVTGSLLFVFKRLFSIEAV